MRGRDECWEWQGARRESGHGQLWVGGRLVAAHRRAWETAHGEIPDGVGYHGTCVCHHCDNPPCCNPAHLFLGTHAENMADMATKARASRGEGRPNHRLSEADVREIIARRDAGASMRAMAREYGVAHGTIAQIGVRSWLWVEGAESHGETSLNGETPGVESGVDKGSDGRSIHLHHVGQQHPGSRSRPDFSAGSCLTTQGIADSDRAGETPLDGETGEMYRQSGETAALRGATPGTRWGLVRHEPTREALVEVAHAQALLLAEALEADLITRAREFV